MRIDKIFDINQTIPNEASIIYSKIKSSDEKLYKYPYLNKNKSCRKIFKWKK